MDRHPGLIEVRTGVRMPYLEQGYPNGVPLILVHAVGDSGGSSRVYWTTFLSQSMH